MDFSVFLEIKSPKWPSSALNCGTFFINFIQDGFQINHRGASWSAANTGITGPKMSLDKQNRHPYTVAPRRQCLIQNKLKGWG